MCCGAVEGSRENRAAVVAQEGWEQWLLELLLDGSPCIPCGATQVNALAPRKPSHWALPPFMRSFVKALHVRSCHPGRTTSSPSTFNSIQLKRKWYVVLDCSFLAFSSMEKSLLSYVRVEGHHRLFVDIETACLRGGMSARLNAEDSFNNDQGDDWVRACRGHQSGLRRAVRRTRRMLPGCGWARRR